MKLSKSRRTGRTDGDLVGMRSDRERGSEKTRRTHHCLIKRPPAMPFKGKQLPNRRRLSRKQVMEIYSEGKYHQPQSSITCPMHYKALKLKTVSIHAPTQSHSEEDKNSFYNDMGEIKPLTIR
jgi:hypothetical protein